METKHTKGEWIYDFESKSVATTDKVLGDIICDAPEYAEESMKNWEANAKLIASAPDLLEALICVERWASEFGMGSTQYKKVINAIKKATE